MATAHVGAVIQAPPRPNSQKSAAGRHFPCIRYARSTGLQNVLAERAKSNPTATTTAEVIVKHSPVNKMQNSPCVSCLLVFPVSPRSCLLSQVTNNKQMRPLVPLVTQSLATVMSDNTPCLHPPHILDTRSPVSCHCLPHGCIMLVEKECLAELRKRRIWKQQ